MREMVAPMALVAGLALAAVVLLGGCATVAPGGSQSTIPPSPVSQELQIRESVTAVCGEYVNQMALMAEARASGQLDDEAWSRVLTGRRLIGPKCEDIDATIAGSANPSGITAEIRALLNTYLLTGAV